MDSSKHQAIAQRAYALWEQEGRPDGRDVEHWRQAEEELARLDRKGPYARPVDSVPEKDMSALRVVRARRKPTLASRRGRGVSPDAG